MSLKSNKLLYIRATLLHALAGIDEILGDMADNAPSLKYQLKVLSKIEENINDAKYWIGNTWLDPMKETSNAK